MNSKRIVFIVDEAHRSTFGDMLRIIKDTFSSAIFFGFTGTPILDEHQKKMNTTSDVFGDELHRYSIADGIRDKNVLGFDPYKILTHKDRDLRKAVALEKAKAANEAEALSDPAKKAVFNTFMNDVKMAGYTESSGKYIKGIEDYIPKSQYETDTHREKIIEDIGQNWTVLSQNSKFHAIFATSSINEAIVYYRLFKKLQPHLKITALFDAHIDNVGDAEIKEDGLVEILEDYNARYGQDYTLATHSKFKKDISSRLSHKAPYLRIETTPEKQIDILIVVDQMLTGFDSKWINTLYLDKVLQYENIIQAFSRTNRLFGPDKPFGTIRYYRLPHTMEQHINRAVRLYSGDKPVGLFVDHLEQNLKSLNSVFDEISRLFHSAGIENFEKLPTSTVECGKFAKLFKNFNNFLEAAKIQGFNWKTLKYSFGQAKETTEVLMNFDENIYLILALRYKELFGSSSGGGGGPREVPFEIEGHLTEIDTDKIDADYMNSRFVKYLKTLKADQDNIEDAQSTLDELHKSFAGLTQEEQKYANIFIHDVQSGAVRIENGMTFREYVTQYLNNAKNDQIHKLSTTLGLDELKLRKIMDLGVTARNINEYGRFDELKSTVNKEKAKVYFEERERMVIPAFKINMKIDALLQEFIVSGGFDI